MAPRKKLDRRVRRTRRALADALIQLIHEKEYEAITITDIAETADLNRATFYLHYGSREELLIAMLEEQFDELVSRMAEIDPAQPMWQMVEPEILVFEHVAAHAEMYKVLLGGNGVGYVINRVMAYIAAVVEAQLKDVPLRGEDPAVSRTLIAQHVAGSLYAQISWWLGEDMPYSPTQMGKMTHSMCLYGTMELVAGDAVPDVPRPAEVVLPG